MKIKNGGAGFVLVILFSLIFFSCRKSDRDLDTDLSAAENNSLSENILTGVIKSIGQFTDTTWQIRSSTCAVSSIVPTDTFTFPKTLTINFGTSNCLCADGNQRRGVITANFSGKYRDSLTVINITLTNYYHNDNSIITGSFSITNKGRNASGHLNYLINVQNAAINTSSGSISLNCSQNMEWISGEATIFNPFDDIYSITGASSGRGIDGNSFTSTINTPLIIALNCAYIEKGSFTLSPANLSNRVVDFGSGNCDNQATISINSKSYDFTQ